MKRFPRLAMMAAVSTIGLAVSYGVIFTFYVAGLLGDWPLVPSRAWERTFRATILLGPVLAGFLLLGLLAWRERWTTGLLPWVVGALGVIVVARHDAGILSPFDTIWIVVFLAMAALSQRSEGDGEE